MPHAALWVVQPEAVDVFTEDDLFQCRTRLCGWCSKFYDFVENNFDVVSMPHAALWVVQPNCRELLL